MTRKELETYYFCTPDLNTLRFKYFNELTDLIGVENLFNNEKLTVEDHWSKLTDMADKIIEYIFAKEKMKYDFVKAYGTEDDYILGELIVQSLVAHIAVELELDMNILKNKRSILYFENTYPKNILIYKDKHKSGTLFEYIEFFELFKTYINNNNEIFYQNIIYDILKILNK